MSSDSINGTGGPEALLAGARRGGLAKIAAGAGMLAILAGLGLWLVLRFIAAEEARDLVSWQARLGIVADSRAAAVSNWLEGQKRLVRRLAENASLQLYLTLLADLPAVAQEDDEGARTAPAQVGYLRNLLTATALQAGLFDDQSRPTVNANVAAPRAAGIALTDRQGRILVATEAMPGFEGLVPRMIRDPAPGAVTVVDVFEGASGRPTMAFMAPVFGIQDEPAGARVRGVVVAVMPVDRPLAERLVQPGDTSTTAETYLVRKEGDLIRYLTAVVDDVPPFRLGMGADTPNLAAAFALATPGGFARAVDYRGQSVLVTGRLIPLGPIGPDEASAGPSWTLVRKIDAREALSGTERRSRMLIMIFALAIVVLAVGAVALWRHATTRRAEEAEARARLAARRYERLVSFMGLVTDGQPTVIAALDSDGRFTFANRKAAEEAGVPSEDLIGKTMAQVWGPQQAREFERLNRQALAMNEALDATHLFEEAGRARILKSNHIPLGEPSPGASGANRASRAPDGILLVIEDITALVNERERREQNLQQLVVTLLSVVDRRDPYSAHHSSRVSEVARAIAREMGLSPREAETAALAGTLMNLGKILIPEELLTKTDHLSEAELAEIRESVLQSADLIEGVDFDGPVVEVIRQSQERWDGGGHPKGLRGEALLPEARLLAVANAFVGMISPRAWREALGMDEAADALLQEAGRAFDRRPVMALLNVLDNRGGREQWQHFRHMPA